jgi:5-methylcytosine-specific restriction protein A
VRGGHRDIYRTAQWTEARRDYLQQHPLCIECLPRPVPATHVDHVVPHRGDMRLFWDHRNWQALCASHHSQKTAREVHARKEPRR